MADRLNSAKLVRSNNLVAQEVNGMVYYFDPSQMQPPTTFPPYPPAQTYPTSSMGMHGMMTPSPAPTPIPAIAPVESPESESGGGDDVGVVVADPADVDSLAVAVAESEAEAGVLEARSLAALKVRAVADGEADSREEKVLFICLSVRFVRIFSGVAQQMFI